jgi:hypothetical protein
MTVVRAAGDQLGVAHNEHFTDHDLESHLRGRRVKLSK